MLIYKKNGNPGLPESIGGTLSQMMDFSLLKDPVFLLIGVANVFGMLGFYTPYVYLPGAAIEKVSDIVVIYFQIIHDISIENFLLDMEAIEILEI